VRTLQEAAERIAQLEAQNAKLRGAVEALEPENAELRAAVEALKAENAELRALIEDLRARLNQNSSNSSLPPSSDRPWNKVRRARTKDKGKRRRGGQKGHRKHSRELLPPEQCDAVHDEYPRACATCGGKLPRCSQGQPVRHQVTEVPEVKPRVDEYRCHSVLCTRCGTVTVAALPQGVPNGAFGPRLMAMVALLTGWFRLSKRNTREALEMMFSVQMSLGAVSNCERQMGEAVAAPVAEARDHMASRPVRHADETSWKEGTRKAWLWVACTPLVAVFMIQAQRATDCARHLLGKAHGILVSDRLGSYLFWPMHQRQVCWSHLLREFEGWAQRTPGTFFQTYGSSLLPHAHQMFKWWHHVRDGTLSRARFRRLMSPLRKDVERLLEQAEHCGDPTLGRKCHDILHHRQALWTFVRVEGVEPTNNQAEHDVRHAVLMRKTSFGTDSPRGSRFVERMLTVVASLRKQRRDPLAFLVECACATLQRHPTPSLLPS
jgi:transposase